MLTKNKIPFIEENSSFKRALNLINIKKLGLVIVRNKKKETIGIFTDGDIKRSIQKFSQNRFNWEVLDPETTQLRGFPPKTIAQG